METVRNLKVSLVYMDLKVNIIEKADTLFRRYGIRGVTVDDICSDCGISKKTIYKYYKDKHTIANKSIEYHHNNLHLEIQEIIKKSSNSIETFFKISKHFRNSLNDMTPLFIHDLKKYHPDLYKITQEYKERLFEKTLQNVILNGKNEGLIRKEINEIIVSKLRIEMIEIGFNQDVFPLKNYNFRDIQYISFDLFIRGIVTEKGLMNYEQILNQKIK